MTQTADTLLEVLIYKISPGKREAFHQALQHSALPRMERAGLTLVGFGPSRHDQDSYYLLRAYPSMEYHAQTLGRHYQDLGWLEQHHPELSPMVETCSVVVVPCEPEGIEKLKHTIYY